MVATGFLRIDTNADALAAEIEKVGRIVDGAPYGLATDAFRDIRNLLMDDVRAVLNRQAFVPNTEATRAYKARMGLDSRVLFATGNTYAGLDGASGTTWAKAMRGVNEWYIFLHDKGRGKANWSRDDRPSKSKSKSRAVPGMTSFPVRQAFQITPEGRSSILARLELFYQTVMDEVGQ